MESGTKLENLHPAMPLSTRIAVVGGGPSGLAAALALAKLGYEHVTVLERQPTVGGMCASAVVEGRVYDLGGQVLARESSPTLRTLMAEMDIEMEDMSEHRLSRIDCATGKYEDLKVAADYMSLMSCTAKLQAEAAATGRLGVHALSDLAHQPADEYLRSRGVANSVPVAVADGYTASGYGYPADMPYAYLHEFARTSMLGKIWRVKGGYSSFWEKVANSLPDVRCNVEVTSIDRTGDKVEVAISTNSGGQTKLEFDKLIMTGSIAYPCRNPTYRSQQSCGADGETLNCRPGILDYTAEELQLFSKVRTNEYYTTVLKISGLDLPVGFYYPKVYSDDPNTIGHPVAVQRFFADSDVFLFWSYGSDQVPQERVMELLLEDVTSMGGQVVDFVLQRKWNYFPHVSSTDMAEGFYDKMHELQGKNNTFYLGALLAFELTERNVSYAFDMVSRYFGTTEARPYVKKLMLLSPANDTTQLEGKYAIKELDQLPGVVFPDLPSLDAYLSYYAKHSVVGERVLYTWLDDQGKEVDKRTFANLDMRVNVVAHRLLTGKAPVKAGDRVLLLHPPGLDFIDAFLGCLRARVLPVPLIPPDPTQRGGQALAKVENVAKACDAKAILSTYAYHTAVRAGSVRNILSPSNKATPTWPNLPWLHTDSWTSRGRTPWNWLFSRSPSFSGSASMSPRESALEREQLTRVPKLNLPNDRAPFKPKSGSRPQKSLDFPNDKNVYPIPSPRPMILPPPQEAVSLDEELVDYDFGPPPNPDDVCFLQFTSGSTGDAKGVMISHGGLIHNVKLMRSQYMSTSRTVLVSWLPQYHDMGLIGGLITAMVSAGTAVLFSPTTFIRKPMLWLEAMDKYKCTHSAVPNFALELIVKRYEQLMAAGRAPTYDFSSMRFLMASAEPLRHKTMRYFLELLHGSGLREQVMAPGYGLAENCVFVSAAYGRREPILIDWQGRVCCGYTQKGNKDMDIRIVDPTTLEEKEAGIEGEIWVHSPSIGVGYWGEKELSEKTFCNSISNANADDDKGRKFLRTGDLGRVIDGKLFVTGRIKDLIIVRGRNFYPADIEKVVENVSDALRPGCCAVFSAPHKVLQEKGVIPPGATEEAGVVVVAELRDEKKLDAALSDLIKASVAEEYGLEVAHVSLIKPRTIAKTTSGKIRRIECLKRFVENHLETVKVPLTPKRYLRRWDSAPLFRRSLSTDMSNAQIPSPRPQNDVPCKQDIVNFLINIVAERTGTPAKNLSVDESFSSYSIDSVGIVWAAQKLSDFLGVHVAAIDIYTAGCISELAETSECLVRKSRSYSCTTPRQPPTPSTPAGGGGGVSRTPSKREITRFLIELVAERTGIPAGEISSTENLTAYNIDSVGVVWAAQKMSHYLGVHVAAIDVYTAGCIDDLAETTEALVKKANPSDDNNPQQSHFVDTAVACDLDFLEGETLSDHELSYSLEPSLSRRVAISSLQAVGILYIATLLLIPAAFIYGSVIKLATSYPGANSLLLAVSLVPLAWMAYMGVTTLIISVCGTCVLQPNFTFGLAIPLWSVRYVKWWTLYRLQEFASTILAVHLRGTIFLVWWYRFLGAHIGKDVQLDTTDITDPGLLFVGNSAVIDEGATVQCHEVKGGIVYFRPVRINNEAKVGAFSVIQRGTVIDVGASITALGKTDVGQRVIATTSKAPEQISTSIVKGLRQVFGLYLVGLVSTTAAVVAYLPFMWVTTKLEIFPEAECHRRNFSAGCILFALAATFPWALVGVAPVVAFETPSVLLHFLVDILERRKLVVLFFNLGVAYFIYGLVLSIFTIALKWRLIGSLDVEKKAKIRSTSRQFFHIWLVHTLLRFTHLKFISLLSGTEATCIYLRGLGAKIGKLASIRGVNAIVDPDLFSLGPRSHLGDFAKIITSVNHNDSSISLGKVTIGAGCMVGAQSVVMPGATLEDQSWLGAMSVAPTNSVLQSGGVYVGVDSPVKIYQKNVNGVRVPANSDGGEKDYRIEQMDPLYQKIVANLSASIAKTTLSVDARYFHRLGVGGKGVIKFMDALPGFPEHEVFAPGRSYPVIVRHSNSLSGDDDARMDARGASLRILQPNCGTDVDAAILDLTLKTGKGFYARNLIEFVSYLTKNQEARLKHVEQFPHKAQMIWDSLKDCNSFCEMHYYSNLVRRLGYKDGECYIKFRMRPADLKIDEDRGRVQPPSVLPPETGAIPRSEGDDRPLRFLAQDFKSKVTSPQGVKYVFQVQLRPISNLVEENEEALDCTKPWDDAIYPYTNIAEVHLTEVLDDEVVEKIRFNPRNGPSSIGMIPARTASESASMDHGRSLAYDIAQYLRNGISLPSAWQKLLNKADQQVPINTNFDTKGGGGCPALSGCLPANVQVLPVPHKNMHMTPTKDEAKTEVDAWELAMIRFFQPLLQSTIPFMLMSLSFYPSLLALALVGSKFGQEWMQNLLPIAYLFSGTTFAAASILARRILVGQTKDGDKSELWGMRSLCDTTWQSINMVLNSTFLMLGKGSLLTIWYLRSMGASICSSAYIDTNYALNPDLLSIGAGSAVGHNALLFGHLYEGGRVGFKPNLIGNYASVGTRALILPGAKLQDDSELAALGLGMKDEVIVAY